MMQKRERIDIIYDMLAALLVKGGRLKRTHLMYRANLAHRQLKTYLDELLEKGLVLEETDAIVLSTQGAAFLQKLREMREFESAFGFSSDSAKKPH